MQKSVLLTSACCINHCVVWTVFPLVPRYKTAANAGVSCYRIGEIVQDILDKRFVLVEAAIVERVRRDYSIDLHETLVHAPLIYTNQGRRVLK